MRVLQIRSILLRSHGLVSSVSPRQTASTSTAPLRIGSDALTHTIPRPSFRTYGTGNNRGKPDSKERTDKDKLHKATLHSDKLAKAGIATGGSKAGNGDDRPRPNEEEPFDMADLEHAWVRATEKHEAVLKQLRTGGRFSPDVLGAIPVKPDRKLPETLPLRDLATVVPPKSGRRWSILCYDRETKPAVKSAFQASPKFNQQPQDSPDNELELIVTVEPERTDELERKVKETCHTWREAIRAGRSARDRVHKTWKANKVIVKDDLVKLDKQLQTMQDAKMAEIKTKELEAIRLLRAREK